jgi:hypothetical protein
MELRFDSALNAGVLSSCLASPFFPYRPALLDGTEGKGAIVTVLRSTGKKDQKSKSTVARYFFGRNGCSETLFEFPVCSAEQRRRAGSSRRGLFEPRRGEFRSAPQEVPLGCRPALRVAQGSRRSRPRKSGSPFLWLLSFGEAKESTPAFNAEYSLSPIPKNPKKSPLIFGLRTRSTVEAPGVHP